MTCYLSKKLSYVESTTFLFLFVHGVSHICLQLLRVNVGVDHNIRHCTMTFINPQAGNSLHTNHLHHRLACENFQVIYMEVS